LQRVWLVDEGEHDVATAGKITLDGCCSRSHADASADLLQLDLEAKRIAGSDLTLESDVVDPREERQLISVIVRRQYGDPADLGHRLDDEHPWHHRVTREVALEKGLVDRHLLDTHGAMGRGELDDSIHEEKGVAMGQDSLDALGIDARELI
jgi:hypothetical protein